jgi:hypothetical protein
MKIKVWFPRTVSGQTIEVYDVQAIPHVGESLCTHEDDQVYDIRTVTHVMLPGLDGVIAHITVS